jgi:putative transposase
MTNTPHLTEAQAKYLEQFLPVVKKTKPRKWEKWLILQAIFYILKTGCQWRELPEKFPPYKTVHHYFRIWRMSRLIDDLNIRLNQRIRVKQKKKKWPSVLILDSQSVYTTDAQRFSRQFKGYDGHKKVKGVKRFILTDTMGNVWTSLVVPANTAEIVGAKRIISYLLSMKLKLKKHLRLIIADAGFNDQNFKKYLKQTCNLTFWVKPKKDTHKVKLPEEIKRLTLLEYTDKRIGETKRWIVERTFSWLDKCRRILNNFEQNPKSHDAFVKLAMIRLNVRRMVGEN